MQLTLGSGKFNQDWVQKCFTIDGDLNFKIELCSTINFKFHQDWVRRCPESSSTIDAGLKVEYWVKKCLESCSTIDGGLWEAMTSFSLQQFWQQSTSHGGRKTIICRNFPFLYKTYERFVNCLQNRTLLLSGLWC